ncbi:MAG: hypothetical protein MUF15_10805 [Acidobacteria bacterium]|nr:hypothetical protein [Acidobacteriota bacterium]
MNETNFVPPSARGWQIGQGYNTGAVRMGYPSGWERINPQFGAVRMGYPAGAVRMGYPSGSERINPQFGAVRMGYPAGAVRDGLPCR